MRNLSLSCLMNGLPAGQQLRPLGGHLMTTEGPHPVTAGIHPMLDGGNLSCGELEK